MPSETEFVLMENGGAYSYTPQSNSHFEILVYTSEAAYKYDQCQPGEGQFSVEYQVRYRDGDPENEKNKVTYSENGYVRSATNGEMTKLVLDNNTTSVILNVTVAEGYDYEVTMHGEGGNTDVTEDVKNNNNVLNWGVTAGDGSARPEICFFKNSGGEGDNSQSTSISVGFPTDATINGGVVTYNVGEPKVTVTVDNGTIGEDNRVEVQKNNLAGVGFILNNFNPETMEVKLSGANDFNTTLPVTTESEQMTTSLAQKDNEVNLPDSLELQVVMKNNGGGNEPSNPGDPSGNQPSDPTDYPGAKAAIEADRFAYYATGNNQKETIKGYLATELWNEYFNPGRPYAGMFDTHNEAGEVVEGTIDTLKNTITLSESTSTDGGEIAKGNDKLSYYTYQLPLFDEDGNKQEEAGEVFVKGKVYILNSRLDVVIATTYNDITSYKVETITESTNDVKVLANYDRDDRGDAMIDVFGNGVSAIGKIEGGPAKVWGAHVTQEHSGLGGDSTIGKIGFRCFVAQNDFIGTKVTGSRNAAAWDFINATVYEVSSDSKESSWAEVFYGNNEVIVESDGFGRKVIEKIELDIAKIPESAATITKIQEGTFTIQLNSGYDSIPIKVMYEGDTVTYYQTIHRIGLALGDEQSQVGSNNYVIWHGTDHTVKYVMPENANHVVYASFYYRANDRNEVKPVNLYATICYKDGTVERKNITSAITQNGTVVEDGKFDRESQNQDKVAGQGTDKYYDDFVVWSGSEEDYQKIKSVDIFAYEKSSDPSIFGGAKIGSGDGYTWKPDNRQ